MTLARAARAIAALLSALAFAGCSSLPSFADASDPGDAAPPDAAPASGAASSADTARADYRLDVQAPSNLRKLLLDYLDLARFQNAPAADAIDAAELERLRRAAPAQARALLETEGYFNAQASVDRVDEPGSDKPLLRVVVDPGPRTRVTAVDIGATGPLKAAADAGDAAAVATLASLRADWKLPVGDFFRQNAWAGAKASALTGLRVNGYAGADWASTRADVDAPANSARLALEADSGPLYRLGPLHISGLKRYDAQTVHNLAQFAPGEAYSEKALLDYQERLQKVGLFEGASVEIDPAPQTADAAPVLVRVREQPLQQATVGIGYTTNTGPRLSVEHTHRQAFGLNWIAKNKFELGPKNQQWDGDLTSYPREDLYRNFVGGSAQRLLADDQTLTSYALRAGRFKEEPRIDRRYFAEISHARIANDQIKSQADAASLNFHWVYRDLDSVLLPTRGYAVSTQSAVGYSSGYRQFPGEPEETSKGPFGRLYGKLSYFRPLGEWYGSARIEAGEVFTKSSVGIPDTLLFRAGGTDSVRGYGYRTLGPTLHDVTIGGRTLLTANLELARPILPKYPDYLWAVFVDAGNAADRWVDLKPEFGYGAGLRWRSPVGPLSFDLAYGQAVRQVRVHVSVGITF